jgi:hypothetical protein
MASEVEIANAALTKLGHAAISNLTDDSDAARAVNAVFATVRDDLQAVHSWNFNTRWSSLAKLADAPVNPNFGSQYALATNTLRVWSIGEDMWPWVVEGTSLLTDLDSPKVQNSYRVTDTSLFPPYFVNLMAYRLAAELCISLTARRGNLQDHWTLYEKALAEAKTSDGQEGSPFVDDASPLADVRLFGSSGVSVNKLP